MSGSDRAESGHGFYPPPVRLLVTSDLHVDHGRSRSLADAVIAEINTLRFDVLLVVGDTATSRGDALERGLAGFTHPGPKLVTLGNHELWSPDGDTLELCEKTLPARLQAAGGWHCLDVAPVVIGGVGFAGSVGWYDYSFAPAHIGVPRRFYEAKIAPGSAAYYTAHRHLLDPDHDIPPAAHDIIARWNDGRYVRWPAGFTDTDFCDRLLARLDEHLQSLSDCHRVVAAVHHLPHRALLPPPSTPGWDFAKAYLGTHRFAEVIARHANVTHVFSGHSHFPAECSEGPTQYLATGSGYRQKRWHLIELD